MTEEKGKEMRNRITIQEFAEKTGVSIATISRAFTGNGRISPETRKRILEAAGKYGYSAGTRKLKSECDIPEIVFFYPELYSGEPDYFTAEIIVNIKRHLGNDHIFTVTPFDENDDHIIDSAKVRMLNGSVAGFPDLNTILSCMTTNTALFWRENIFAKRDGVTRFICRGIWTPPSAAVSNAASGGKNAFRSFPEARDSGSEVLRLPISARTIPRPTACSAQPTSWRWGFSKRRSRRGCACRSRWL